MSRSSSRDYRTLCHHLGTTQQGTSKLSRALYFGVTIVAVAVTIEVITPTVVPRAWHPLVIAHKADDNDSPNMAEPIGVENLSPSLQIMLQFLLVADCEPQKGEPLRCCRLAAKPAH